MILRMMKFILIIFTLSSVLAEEGKTLSIETKDTNIIEILKIISQNSHKNIILSPNVRGKVTVFLNNVPYDQALKAILETASLAYIDDEGIMKIMPDSEYQKIYGYSFYDNQQKKIIKVQYANASDIAARIAKLEPKAITVVDELSNSILIKSSEEKIEDIKLLIAELDRKIITDSCQLKYLDDKQVEKLVKMILSGKGEYYFNNKNKEVIIKDYEENNKAIINLLNKHDIPGNIITKSYELDYAKFDVIEAKLKELITKDLGQIITDERTNKVILTDLEEVIAKADLLIEEYDSKDRQVLIEAKIVQVILSDSFQWGINWQTVIDSLNGGNLGLRITNAFDVADELITAAGFADSALDNATITEDSVESSSTTSSSIDHNTNIDEDGKTTSTSASSLQNSSTETRTNGVSERTPFNTNVSFPSGMGGRIVATGTVNGKQFEGVLNALKTLGDTKVLSSPRIITLNNEEAKIQVASKEAYVTSTTVTPGSGPSTTSENVTFMDVGISLSVTPKINKKDFITLNVKPSVSSVTETLQTASGNKIPIVSTQEVESKIQVKNGTTIVLGGIHEQYHDELENSLPILGDIPIIGYLFKKIEKRMRNSELVIFITPRIITGEKSFYDLENEEMDIVSSDVENFLKEKEVIDKAREFEKNTAYEQN